MDSVFDKNSGPALAVRYIKTNVEKQNSFLTRYMHLLNIITLCIYSNVNGFYEHINLILSVCVLIEKSLLSRRRYLHEFIHSKSVIKHAF